MSLWKTLFSWWTSEFDSRPKPSLNISELTENEDHLYLDAARFVISTGRCSISAVQHHLKIGYNRAALLVKCLEDDHVVSKINSDGSRYLLSEQQRQAARLLPSRAEIERQRKAEGLALRIAYLSEKYADQGIVKAILDQKIWEGMTAAHLFDSAGEPEIIDQKYMKAKSREVWKYHHEGGNRFLLRVTLENGIVVGWDAKG